MKKFLILFLLLFCGCQKEEILKDKSEYLRVSFANDTKTHVQDYSNVWDEGDTIYLVSGRVFRLKLILKEKISNHEALFKTAAGVGITNGTYSAYLGLEPTANNTWSVKEQYTVKNQDDHKVFAYGTIVWRSSVNTSLYLKNICGIIRLKLNGPNYGIAKIQIVTDKKISGKINVNTGLVDGVNYRDYVFPTLWNTDEYCIALPPQTYNQMKFIFTFYDGSVCEKTLKNPITIERGGIHNFEMRVTPAIE